MCSLCLGHEPISSPQYASSVIFGPVAFARLVGVSVRVWGGLGHARFAICNPHSLIASSCARPNYVRKSVQNRLARTWEVIGIFHLARSPATCKKLAVSASSRGVISTPSLGPLERR